jgi:hypothetical protein
MPALADASAAPGLTWKVYDGEFPWVPNLTNSKEDRTHTSTTIETELPAKATSTAHGFLKVPSEGNYTFHLEVAGKAVVRLHDAILIDADYGYPSGEERHSTVRLEGGLHPLTIWVTAGDAQPKLSLEWTVDGTRSTISETALFQPSSK